MNNAIGSKTMLDDYTNYLTIEYNDCISDLIESADVQKLNEFFQHANTSRLQHCINVSYYSYLICKFLHFDFRSAARAGILHDLFLYDWHLEKQPEGLHAFAHPKIALRNAKQVAELNPIEEDAIVNHMFPVTITFPRYKESYVVSIADKYCATIEIFTQIGFYFNNKSDNIFTKIFKKKTNKVLQ